MKSVQSVQEELKSVLDIFNKREKHLEILKTPEVYITASSNPKEVQKWLKEKQFSKRLQTDDFYLISCRHAKYQDDCCCIPLPRTFERSDGFVTLTTE